MHLNDKGILVLDTETTGTDPDRDQIIELSAQYGLAEGSPAESWRIKPTVPIHPEAQALHGISMDDLVDCKGFAEYAEPIRRSLEQATILVGYNLRFDLDMIEAELRRLNARPLDLATKILIDPYRLWKQCEPRTLQGAHRRFVGRGFDGAHSATSDTAATARVLLGMLRAFGFEAQGWTEIARIYEPDRERWVGPSHHIQWREGLPTVMFGRHKGTPLARLAIEHGGDYLQWMLTRDFPRHVDAICTKALELDADALHDWLDETFGPPTRVSQIPGPMS